MIFRNSLERITCPPPRSRRPEELPRQNKAAFDFSTIHLGLAVNGQGRFAAPEPTDISDLYPFPVPY